MTVRQGSFATATTWGRVELRWHEAGSGRPLVLVHCYPVDGRIFEAQLRAAADGDLPARLIAPDLPGFGSGPLPERPPDRYTVRELAEVITALIAHLGLTRPVVGGVAIGGSIALDIVRARPHLAGGLVLMANRAVADAPALAAAREATAQRALRDGSAAIAPELARAALSPDADGAVRARVTELIADADRRAIAALVRAISARPDHTALLPSIWIPALVIAGGRDPFGSTDAVRAVAALLPRARSVEIPAAGHMPPIEAPAEVTAELAGFVASLG